MKYNDIAGFKTPDKYIDYKINRLLSKEATFSNLYKIMFEDANNILFEYSEGIKIKKVTYGQAKDKVELYSRNITKLFAGYSHNSIIGIYLENSDKWIEIFWAILKSGFRPLLLNMRLSDEILENSIKNLDFAGIIGENCHINATIYSVENLEDDSIEDTENEFGDTVYVMSSGTSNNVKLCAYTIDEFYRIILQSRDIVKSNKKVKGFYDGNLKLLTFLPFYHIFGLVAVYLWFGFYARTFVKLNDMYPQTIQNTIKRHKVTHIFAVPLLWQKTYEAAMSTIKSKGDKTYRKFNKGLKIAEKVHNIPLLGDAFTKLAFKEVRQNLFGESIQFLIAGGSHIESRVMTFFNAIGYHLCDGYGMSEIGISCVELSNNYKLLNSCSVGKPLSGINFKINDDGELLVNSESSAKYIIENSIKTEVNGAWFNTHDLAKYENGRYYLLGRDDDVIISNTGENLNPNIIEEKLYVDGVNGICLIADKQNQPTLLVSINKFLGVDHFKKIEDAVKNKIKEHNLTSLIGKVDFVCEDFIAGEDFKVNRKSIANRYFSGGMLRYSDFSSEETDVDELVVKIKEYFAVSLNKNLNEISSKADFFLDLGGTSLDYFALLSKIKIDFGLSIPPDENGVSLSTAQGIADYIRSHL